MGLSSAVCIALLGLLTAPQALASNVTSCHHDNCYREVAGTRLGTAFQAQATLDCQSFMGLAIATTPVVSTATVIATSVVSITITKRAEGIAYPTKTIPFYASKHCSVFSQYSSACSCMGYAVTLIKVDTTITRTITTALTRTFTMSSTSSAVPCMADILNDPLNCGRCGKVCSTGICENGSCSSNQCPNNQRCEDGFKTCGTANCFCFSDYTGKGFCGQNAVCNNLTFCKDNKDCNSGSVCATHTCCNVVSDDKPGICLVGECANPQAKLARMAAMLRRNYVGGDTAAWKGWFE